MSHSSLLIPIHTLTSLGLSNSWDANSRTVTIENTSGDVLTITLDSNIAYENGKRIEMSVPAQSKHGRVLVPIRFVSESMGYQVHYETIRNIIFVVSSEHTFDADMVAPSDLVSARKEAISLPIVTDFKTVGFATRRDVTYRFPEGKADMYEFNDGFTHTVVKIESGKAVAMGQYTIGDRSNILLKAGEITGENTVSDPILEPFLNAVYFNHTPNTTITNVIYWEVDSITGDKWMKTIEAAAYKVYYDIIQEVPTNL